MMILIHSTCMVCQTKEVLSSSELQCFFFVVCKKMEDDGGVALFAPPSFHGNIENLLECIKGDTQLVQSFLLLYV